MKTTLRAFGAAALLAVASGAAWADAGTLTCGEWNGMDQGQKLGSIQGLVNYTRDAAHQSEPGVGAAANAISQMERESHSQLNEVLPQRIDTVCSGAAAETLVVSVIAD